MIEGMTAYPMTAISRKLPCAAVVQGNDRSRSKHHARVERARHEGAARCAIAGTVTAALVISNTCSYQELLLVLYCTHRAQPHCPLQ